MSDRTYSAAEVARYTGASYFVVRRWLDDGTVPHGAPVSFDGLALVWALWRSRQKNDDGSSATAYKERGAVRILRPAPHVWISRDHHSGDPCLDGTRIPTEILAGRFAAGESIADIAADYAETTERIEAAIRFEMR